MIDAPMHIAALTLLLLGATPARPPGPPQPQALQLLGTVGEFDVRMTLRIEGGQAVADYAYATGDSIVSLSGSGPAADGALKLAQDPLDADSPESFEGRLDLQQAQFAGVWTKAGKSLPFSLRALARLLPLGGRGPCRTLRVLAFDLPDPALSQALTAAAKALAEKTLEQRCRPDEDFGGRQQLWAISDGLVSIRTFYGNGLPKGSDSESVVLDTRASPPRELALEEGALNARKLRETLAREADRLLRRGEAPSLPTVLPAAKETVGETWNGWAVTPVGIQLFFRQTNWAASGDGTRYALVRLRALKGLYRPESRLGKWVEGSSAP